MLNAGEQSDDSDDDDGSLVEFYDLKLSRISENPTFAPFPELFKLPIVKAKLERLN